MQKNVNGINYEMAAEEIAEMEADKKEMIPYEIESLKFQLSESDYKAIKYAEGWITEEEYAPIKAERQQIRDKINQLEAEIKNKELI